MNVNVLPADTYIVVNKTILNDQDRKILTSLYQPIIGNVAISLYFTLWSYLDKSEMISNEWTHHHLMTSMRLKLDDIIEARIKLEAIGLLKTFYYKNHVKHFVYQLYSPLSVSEFLKNPILSTTLFNNVGKTEYENIINYFKIPNPSLSKYEEITASFDEVFEVKPLTSLDSLLEDVQTKTTNNLMFEPNININNVIELLPDEVVNKKSITNLTKDLIIKVAYIYNLNEDDMVDIIRNSINEKKIIDRELLKNNAINYYQFENSGKLPSIVFRTQPQYLREPAGSTSKQSKIINTFETVSPYDLLKSKYKGSPLTKRDKEILSILAIDFDLKPGVINVLLDYVLKINNNKLTKNFVTAIASQWKRSKIETVSEAMDIARKEHSKLKKNSKTKIVKTEPEWFNKEIIENKATDEEIAALEKELESI
jgi:replication initiation and membrane attachment protein